MKHLSIFLTLIIFCVNLIAQTATAPAVGDGTADNPFEITTLENLYWLTAENDVVPDPDQSVRWSSHYLQTADIDAQDTINWFGGQGWKSIGYQSQAVFTGTYDGNNHTIQNLYINRPGVGNIGLFGYTYGATIANLGLIDVDITCSYHGGALVGLNWGSTVNNCYATGSMNGSSYVGGLVGNNFIYSTISDCYSSVNVSGAMSIGGLAGLNETFSVITNSYNRGNVSAPGETSMNIGGLVGWNLQSTIDNSFNSGDVIGADSVGGLVGNSTDESTVTNSYSSGNVTGVTNVGGLVGRNSYSFVSGSYYNAETSGQSDTGNGEPRSTTEMTFPYAMNTYVDWDFEEIWTADEDYSQNNGYPYHTATVVSAEDDLLPLNKQISLYNYPNPFNPDTTIRYSLPENVESLELQIFNIRGQHIKTLIPATSHPKGEYQTVWDGRNDQGNRVTSGIYFYRITTPDSEKVNKMLLLK